MTQASTAVLKFVVGSEHLRIRKMIALSLTFFFFAVIGFLTLLPISVPPVIGGSDKTHHLIAFGVLAIPCALLYPRSLIWVAPAILAFGAAIELVQPYVGRHGELADFYADFKGVVLGVSVGLAVHYLARWLNRTQVSC